MGGIPWKPLASALQNHLMNTDSIVRTVRWRPWYAGHTPTILTEMVREYRLLGIHIQAAREAITDQPIGPLPRNLDNKFKSNTQGWFCRMVLARDRYDPEGRLRHRLARWRLSGFPGRVAPCVHSNLLRLRRLVLPRVCAAVFSTVFNR